MHVAMLQLIRIFDTNLTLIAAKADGAVADFDLDGVNVFLVLYPLC